MKYSILFAAVAGYASAAPASDAPKSLVSYPKVIIGGNNLMMLAEKRGTNLTITMNGPHVGDASWMEYVAPNTLYAIDAQNNKMGLYHLDLNANTVVKKKEATGSARIVSIVLNDKKTRLVSVGYGSGKIDIWNVDGDLKLMKTMNSVGTLGPNKDRQEAHHPHQAIAEPSGRYFIVNDLGSDSIIVIDSKDDKFNIAGSTKVPSPGCGPRHGIFYPQTPGTKATHYAVICEMTNDLHLFTVEYKQNNMGFKPIQKISTYGKNFPPKDPSEAAAGEIILSPDNNHIYISNRLSSNETDSIAHFKMNTASKLSDFRVEFKDTVSSGGILPRQMSFGKDGNFIYVSNQDGAQGIIVLRVNADGSLVAKPEGNIPMSVFGTGETPGPKFIQQLA